MLKTCTECKRLFKGEGSTCTKCVESGPKKEMGECKECGVISTFLVDSLCKICAKGKVDNFKLTKDYLYENPGATVKEVSEELDIPKKEILEFVKEGRLEIKEDSRVEKHVCSGCGKDISPGRTKCLKCKREEEELRNIKQVKSDENRIKFFTNRG